MRDAIFGLLLFALCVAAAFPVRAEITPEELEGHWLLEPYIAALASSRSLLAAADVAVPLTFTIDQYGCAHRMAVTTFHEASWHAIAGIESAAGRSGSFLLGPYETPLDSADTFTRIAFDAERDSGGRVTRLHMTLWGVENAWFRRIDAPAERFVNETLVAGTWRDLDRGRWAFDATGTLLGPQGRVHYAPSIDTSEACCDYLTIDGERVGFTLRDDTMWMYSIFENPDGCPITCDVTRPQRILVRDVAGDSTSRAALSQLELVSIAKDGSRWGGHRARVAIAFDNPDRRPDPGIFPEPPAVVTDSGRGTRCTIDGGIWSRDMVWLSADESLVALVAHSGSGSDLEIYRTNDCSRTAEAPVAARSFRVSADRVEHDGICEQSTEEVWNCVPAAIWRVRPDGTLEHLAAESERRTRGVFGVGFTGKRDIEHPRTDRARVKSTAK